MTTTTDPTPKNDHCPGCGSDGTMTMACTECGHRTVLLASATLPVSSSAITAPAAPAPAAVPAGMVLVPLRMTQAMRDITDAGEWGWADLLAAANAVTLEEYEAAQAAPAHAEPEFTDNARAALLWVLWHHQGGSSPIGQPLRYALGMGAHEELTADQIAAAKAWATLTRSAQAGAPEGWQLVPVEPTPEMILAFAREWHHPHESTMRSALSAMLAAAPTVQAGAGREPVAVCWGLEACVDGVWSLQWPPRMTRSAAENDMKAYDPRNVLRIRPMYFESAPTAHPSPAQREPLSEAEAKEIIEGLNRALAGFSGWGWIDVIRATERAHGIAASGTQEQR